MLISSVSGNLIIRKRKRLYCYLQQYSSDHYIKLMAKHSTVRQNEQIGITWLKPQNKTHFTRNLIGQSSRIGLNHHLIFLGILCHIYFSLDDCSTFPEYRYHIEDIAPKPFKYFVRSWRSQIVYTMYVDVWIFLQKHPPKITRRKWKKSLKILIFTRNRFRIASYKTTAALFCFTFNFLFRLTLN